MIYKNEVIPNLGDDYTFFIWKDENDFWYIHVSDDIKTEFNNLKQDEKFPDHWEAPPYQEGIDTKRKLEKCRDHYQHLQNKESARQIIREELVEHYLSGKETTASKLLKMKEKELDRLEQEHYQKEFQRSLSFSSPLGLFSLISLVLFIFLIFGPELS